MSDTTVSGSARQDAAAEFTMQDPQFRADAYGIYRELREDAPVSLVRFRRAEEEGGGLLDQPGFFSDESWLVTRYDEGVAAMLDTRFTVDHRIRIKLGRATGASVWLVIIGTRSSAERVGEIRWAASSPMICVYQSPQ